MMDADEHQEGKAFYALLEEKIKSTSEYPELSKYLDYLKEANQLDLQKILAEKESLETLIYASLARSKDEKRLYQVSRSKEVLKRLFNLNLTSRDFEALERDLQSFDIVQISGFLNKKIMDLASHYEDALFLDPGYDGAFAKAKEFYDLTRERDRAFLKNILQKMDEQKLDKAVLVTGGYHTDHLKALLKEKGISYASLIPQVLQETNMKKYENILLNQVDGRQKAVDRKDKQSPDQWGVLPGAEASA